MFELIHTFEKCTGVKLNYKVVPRRPGDIEKVWGNVDKANKVLGWKAVHTLEEALSSAWNWQKKLREKESCNPHVIKLNRVLKTCLGF